ncbi:2Fe-2S iron-sulfur cluster-binding protein [Streptomyces sp. NPDC048106]|uniref:2Fe-2S iron-sulfur cluster-binding protein n=1 Tax=Streptomyces sp. NPDC048106 TaxID=3155750 RepID=UPI0034564030
MTVEPSGTWVTVRSGETLIDAAWREGYEWPTLCYGLGQCVACRCEVVDGLEHLSPHTEAETAMLGDLGRRVRRADPLRVRLACQAEISGDVVIRKPGVRPVANDTADTS